jgi:hypothetical protein
VLVPASASGRTKHGTDIAISVLTVLAGALDILQTEAEQRQLGEISRGHWPAQPIFPTRPITSEGTNGAAVPASAPPANRQSGGGKDGGWAASAVEVGMESITVPAGTFECDHYTTIGSTGKQIDVWTSSKVSSSLSPDGLVELSTADWKLKLQKVLVHETSQVKGDPKKMK